MRVARVLLMLLILCVLSAPAQAVDLVHWGSMTFTPSTALEDTQPIYKELYAKYAAENPDVNFTYEVLPGGPEALQKLLAAASVGNLPDVATLDDFWIPRLVEQGLLQPLDNLWPEPEREDFHPRAIRRLGSEDKIYALQFYNSWRGLFYRSDILEQVGYSAPPTDLDEFIEMGLKLKDKGYWAIMMPGNATEVTFLHMLSFFWGFGGELVDDDGRPVFHEGKNRDALRKTYQTYYDLVNVHEIMPKDIITMEEKDLRQYLYSDEVAIIAQSSSSMRGIKNTRPDIYEVLRPSRHPMPQGLSSVGMFGGWTYGIFAKDPATKEAAWRFIETMTASDALGRLNEAHGHLPVRASIFENRPFFREDHLFSDFLDLAFIGETKNRPIAPIYPVISNNLALMMSEVISGMDIDDAIDEAAEEVMLEWERIRR